MAHVMVEELVAYQRISAQIGNLIVKASEHAAAISTLVEDAYVLAGDSKQVANAKAEALMTEHYKTSEHVMAIEKYMREVTDGAVASARAFAEAEKRREKIADRIRV